MAQRLHTATQPHELHLEVAGQRGARCPCPQCGALCPAHGFTEKRWRHLNFCQHECWVTASVPRVKCREYGAHPVEVPWARKGSAFTLLLEQAALALVREMPVLAAARLMDITDTRLWRIVRYYPDQAVVRLELSAVRAIGLDETACKRGHHYVTAFVDMVAIAELTKEGLDTMTIWKPKEKLPWIRKARSPRAALWRITHCLKYAGALVGDTPRLEPVRGTLATLKTHTRHVMQRWTSTHTNARLEGLNGLFQSARARTRGYRSAGTFIAMTYLIGSPACSRLRST